MKVLIAALSICVVAALTASGQARGWRGLVPLHSSRSDVERLLGQPTDVLSESDVFYRSMNETVIISYSNGRPCGIGEKYSQWRVPRDTVERILITPTKQLPFSKLMIDENKYERRSGGHLPEDIYYINDQDGVTIRVFMGDVMGISLYPGRVDSDKACSQPTGVKNCRGISPPPFDSYEDVSLRQEQVLLDSFGVALVSSPDALGYIIAYGGRHARTDEANALAERARNYLVNIRHLPVTRLKTINGGFTEKRKVELYVVSAEGCPPVPNPTIDPRDVQITKPKI